MGFHPAGYAIAAGGGSGGRIWFWKGDELVSSHVIAVAPSARDMALHPLGQRLAIAAGNGSALVYTMK